MGTIGKDGKITFHAHLQAHHVHPHHDQLAVSSPFLSVHALPSRSIPYGILQNLELAMQPQHQFSEPVTQEMVASQIFTRTNGSGILLNKRNNRCICRMDTLLEFLVNFKENCEQRNRNCGLSRELLM
jgi:hypothetical protein